jgi:hypothetical protein
MMRRKGRQLKCNLAVDAAESSRAPGWLLKGHILWRQRMQMGEVKRHHPG